MSSDNGIYILQTKGPEFRIVHAAAIDNIYKFNEETGHWDCDPEMILSYFGESQVYTNLEEAWDKANLMAEDYAYLEDGVCLIREFEEKSFIDAIDGIK